MARCNDFNWNVISKLIYMFLISETLLASKLNQCAIFVLVISSPEYGELTQISAHLENVNKERHLGSSVG